jgi:hypothetical protein
MQTQLRSKTRASRAAVASLEAGNWQSGAFQGQNLATGSFLSLLRAPEELGRKALTRTRATEWSVLPRRATPRGTDVNSLAAVAATAGFHNRMWEFLRRASERSDRALSIPSPRPRQRTRVLAELSKAHAEAANANWDGHGALPSSPLALSAATRFVTALPPSIPDPDVSIDSDGDVSLEWYMGPRAVFSVAIDSTGKVHYAGLFGENKSHGAEKFADQIPEPVALNLARLAREVAGM